MLLEIKPFTLKILYNIIVVKLIYTKGQRLLSIKNTDIKNSVSKIVQIKAKNRTVL